MEDGGVARRGRWATPAATGACDGAGRPRWHGAAEAARPTRRGAAARACGDRAVAERIGARAGLPWAPRADGGRERREREEAR